MSGTNKQRFLAELSKLLGFMSSWDREATIEQYSAMFDAAESEAELLAELGSPTKLAIAIAREYVPTPPPETAAEVPAPGEAAEALPGEAMEAGAAEAAAPGETAEAESPAETGPVFGEETAIAPEMLSALENAVEKAQERETDGGKTAQALPAESPAEESGLAEKRKKRRVRGVALLFYTVAALLTGLPVALVLIALGVPFLLLGVGVVAGAVYLAMELIGMLNMVSDVLMVAGAGLLLVGIGVFFAWLGLWLSIELGCAWIGGVIFRLGAKLCLKKEVPGE